MRTGRQALHEIDGAVAQARTNLEQTNEIATRLAEERAALERRRLEAIATIASERMELIESGDAGAPRDRDMRRADRKAAELLDRHAAEVAELRDRTRAAQDELKNLEAERKTLEGEVEVAIEAFEAAAAAVQEKLAANEAYKDRPCPRGRSRSCRRQGRKETGTGR